MLIMTTTPRSLALLAAKEDTRVSPNRIRSFAPAYLRLLIRACVLSSSVTNITCQALYSFYVFSSTAITCRFLSFSFDMSLVLLLHHCR